MLIIGEAGEDPWSGGPGSERLWRWFGVKSHKDLAAKAKLMNVFEKKNERICTLPHMSDIGDALRESDLIFLVGRIAQALVEAYRTHSFLILWQTGKWVGLPHPFGLNRQLNDLKDSTVRDFILNAIAHAQAQLARKEQ